MQSWTPRFDALAGWLVLCCVAAGTVPAQAQSQPRSQARAQAQPHPPAAGDVGPLPRTVEAALSHAKVPRESLHVMVLDPQAAASPRLSHQANTAVNPASLMKLATTTAALDVLGTSFVWRTPVYVEGTLRDGVLHGQVYVRGSGDPRLTAERLWLLLRRVQGLGIQKIQGDMVLDRSAFALPTRDAASFDGEPLRPYNAAPDALLINFKSLLMHWLPDRQANVARLHIEPPLAGVSYPASVTLSATDCNDYRGGLRPDWSDPTRIRFAGSYPAVCGEKVWPIAYSAPAQFASRAVHGMWLQLGGQLSGQVREGNVPAQLQPAFQFESAPLSEIVRDINKFSNNVMAQQLFLTLSQQQGGVGSFDASREVLQRWWRDRIGGELPVFDNGSGLSRDERISAQGLAQLLQLAWQAGFMSELMSSLPVTGLDGTLKRSKAQAIAHLKTGSLRDVAGIAGYVDTRSGKRLILVAILNHPNANAARGALDALVDWTAQQP